MSTASPDVGLMSRRMLRAVVDFPHPGLADQARGAPGADVEGHAGHRRYLTFLIAEDAAPDQEVFDQIPDREGYFAAAVG